MTAPTRPHAATSICSARKATTGAPTPSNTRTTSQRSSHPCALALPHVPAPVATELKTVRAKVAEGRKQVAAARSASEYTPASADEAADGYVALGNASDLVGDACGFDLTPNLSGP